MNEWNQKKGKFPNIQLLLDSVVCTVPEVQQGLLDWLAWVFQNRKKPNIAWVLHGTFGTGKDTIFDKVIHNLCLA